MHVDSLQTQIIAALCGVAPAQLMPPGTGAHRFNHDVGVYRFGLYARGVNDKTVVTLYRVVRGSEYQRCWLSFDDDGRVKLGHPNAEGDFQTLSGALCSLRVQCCSSKAPAYKRFLKTRFEAAEEAMAHPIEQACVVAALCGITPAEVVAPMPAGRIWQAHAVATGFELVRYEPEESGSVLLGLADLKGDHYRARLEVRPDGKINLSAGPRNYGCQPLYEILNFINYRIEQEKARAPKYLGVLRDRFAAANNRLAAELS